jgi:hypothetical protein
MNKKQKRKKSVEWLDLRGVLQRGFLVSRGSIDYEESEVSAEGRTVFNRFKNVLHCQLFATSLFSI